MAMKLVRLEKAGAVTTVFPTVRARHNCCAGAASQPRRLRRGLPRAQAAVASFDDAVLGQLKALDAGQARTALQPRDAATCARAPALTCACADSRPAAPAAQTLPEADVQNLSKKRKLLDRVCVAVAAFSAVHAGVRALQA